MSLRTEQDLIRRIQRSATTGPASGVQGDDVIHVLISANTAGDNSIINPPGQKFGIIALMLLNGPGIQTIILKDGQLPILQKTNLAAEAGLFFGPTGNGEPHFKIGAGNGLNLNLSVGSLVEGYVRYRLIP